MSEEILTMLLSYFTGFAIGTAIIVLSTISVGCVALLFHFFKQMSTIEKKKDPRQ